MRPESHTRFADRVISTLAGRQHGVVACWQLLTAGVGAEQIKRRVASGRLTELHRGVYLAGALAPDNANEMAALLACRLEATLSHRSAAALWKLLPHPSLSPGLGHDRARAERYQASDQGIPGAARATRRSPA